MDARARLLIGIAIGGTVSIAGAQQDSARVLTAARFQGVVRIDARLDDSVWASAEVATDFRQREPREGAAATLATEVRVLWDDEALYVGARMRDPSPDSIIALLARRDAMTPSDEFFVGIDGDRDRRTGRSPRSGNRAAAGDGAHPVVSSRRDSRRTTSGINRAPTSCRIPTGSGTSRTVRRDTSVGGGGT